MRHLQPCNVPAGHGNLCLVGGPNANTSTNTSTDAYSIVLNGVASRLIRVSGSGNYYRLQNDPYWRVQRLTSGHAGHPDEHEHFWRVTTPDGTVYQFGSEFTPATEGNADQNSVFYVPIYNTYGACGLYVHDLCDVTWRWNLDRVEDTNGNVVSYFYELYSGQLENRSILSTERSGKSSGPALGVAARIRSRLTPNMPMMVIAIAHPRVTVI